MKISEITEMSKQRAEYIAGRDGGFLVPIYAVVETDKKGRVVRVSHDHLNYMKRVNEDGME